MRPLYGSSGGRVMGGKASRKLARRDFLRSVAIMAGLLASAPVLPDCTGPEPTNTPMPTRKPTATTALPTPTAEKLAATPTVASRWASPGYAAPAVAKAAQIEFASLKPEGFIEDTVIKELAKDFEKEHPGITVRVISASQATNQAIQVRLKEGNPPEVLAIAKTVESPLKFKEYWDAGEIYDLTEMYTTWPSYDQAPKTVEQTIKPQIRYTQQWEGRYAIVTRDVRVHHLFIYNRNVFEKFKLEEPNSWGELLEACARLKEGGVIPIAQHEYYPTWYYQAAWYRIMPWEEIRDAWFNTGPGFKENPGFLQGAKLWENLLKSGYIQEEWTGSDDLSSLMRVARGEAAMLMDASWLVGPLLRFPAEFVEGVFRMPAVEGGRGDPTGIQGHFNIYNVAAKSKNPAVGAELMRCWCSKAWQETRARRHSAIPFLEGSRPQTPEWPAAAPMIDIFQNASSFSLPDANVSATEPELAWKAGELGSRFGFGEMTAEEFIDKLDALVKGYYADKAKKGI